MADIIQLRRDTAINFTAANPILAQGEPALEIDTLKEKIGDGLTDWVGLPYRIGNESFLQLTDTPTTYLGQAGKSVIVNSTEDGVDFGDSVGGVALGETDTTAYRGDRGKTAYDHSQVTHAPSNAQKNSDITKAEIESKLTGEITSHTHAKLETMLYACSDETTDLTLGDKISIRMPFAMTLSEVRITLNAAPTITKLIVDVKESGTSIFSTLPSIDAGELSSVTAAIPPVISDVNLADDALLVVSITQLGSGDIGKGLKIVLKGIRI